MRESIAVLAGDGIGPEIMGSAVRVLKHVGDFEFREVLVGGAAIDASGDPAPLVTRRVVRASHAVLLGTIGGPRWETDDPRAPKPETAARTLQKTLDVHTFLRPDIDFDGLADNATAGIDELELRPLVWLNDKGRGIFTPAHGPESDIAGKGVANPLAMILSGAAALKYSLDMPAAAGNIEAAVAKTLAEGVRTPDLDGDATTGQVTDAIIQNLGD